jgi:hypothetical protein
MATTPVNFTLTATDHASTKLALLRAKIEGLTAPVDAIKAKFAGMSQAMNLGGVSSALSNLRTQLSQSSMMVGAGGLVAAGGIAAITGALVRNTIATTDNLGKLQDLHERYKISTDMLQVYKAMGAEAGVEVESLAKAHGFLAQKLAAAAGGEKGAIAMLQGVGISKVDLNKSVESVFTDIADVFSKSNKSQDEILKIDFAKDIFGKAGVDIIPILEKGSGEFKRVLDDLIATGRLHKAAQIEAADGSGDAWTRAQGIMQGLKEQIGLSTLPMLNALSATVGKAFTGAGREKLLQVFTALGDKLAILLPQFIDKLPQVADAIANITGKVLAFGNLVGWENLMLGGFIMLASPFIMSAGGLVLALGRVGFAVGVVAFNAMSQLVPALIATSLQFIKNIGLAWAFGGPLGVLRQLFAMTAVGALTASGGLAAIGGAFLGAMKSVLAFSAALLANPVTWVVAAIAGAAYLIYQNWGGVSSFFSGLWDGIVQGVAPVVSMLGTLGAPFKVLSPVIDWIKGVFSDFFSSGAKGAQDWSSAGLLAGEIIAGVFKSLLTPITLVLDAILTVNNAFDVLSGKKSTFEVSTLTKNLWADVPQNAATKAMPVIPQALVNPVAKAQLAASAKQDSTIPAVQAAVISQQQRATFDGNIKIHVTADGRPQVKEATTGVQGVGMNVSNGMMFAG